MSTLKVELQDIYDEMDEAIDAVNEIKQMTDFEVLSRVYDKAVDAFDALKRARKPLLEMIEGE